MKKRVITYKNLRHLVTDSKRVIEKMENNPAFPNPPAALAELKKELPEYEAALVKARSRDKEWVSFKNDKKAIILALLEELAQYVSNICKDDLTMILSSGFDVTEEDGTTPKPSVEQLEVELGSVGEATTKGSKIKGAVAFVHQYTTEAPGPDTVWVSEESSIRSYTFRGLASDKRHWFRMIAIGRRNQKAYSPVVSRSIQ